MGSEEELEANYSTTTHPPPKLQISFSLPTLKSPQPQQHSGTLTPPLQTTSASVPFRWEKEPGKPFPCTTRSLPPNANSTINAGINLPPRLAAKFTKTPSPTTVLEGPYNRSILRQSSSSFRFQRKKQGSFDGGEVNLAGSSPERGLLGAMVLSSSKKDKGVFGSWRKKGGLSFHKGRSEIHGGNFVFSGFSDDGDGGCDGGTTSKVTMVSRKRSQLGLSQAKSHLWATIYGALKHVIPRRRTKSKWKKDAL